MTHHLLRYPSLFVARARRPGGRLASALLMLCMLGVAQPAAAERHALLMAIGDYAEPSARLKGIDIDMAMAQQLARAWGASASRTKVLKDGQLRFDTLRAALRELAWTINTGDEVLIYFSGHGVRTSRAGGPGCQVGLVTQEGRVLLDAVLLDHLQALASRAGRVVMLTDACHSAGMATKSLERGVEDDAQPKAYPAPLSADLADAKAGSDGRPVDACSVQVNVAKGIRGLSDRGPDRILYLAAAADNEAAFATPKGSLATRAWTHCLKTHARSSGRELTRCAQSWINAQQPLRQQTITPRFNADLPWMD